MSTPNNLSLRSRLVKPTQTQMKDKKLTAKVNNTQDTEKKSSSKSTDKHNCIKSNEQNSIEIQTLKDIMNEQKQCFEQSIDILRHEICTKTQIFESAIEVIASEIDEIKHYQQSIGTNTLQTKWHNTLSNDLFRYSIQNSCIEQLENHYTEQINELGIRISELEKNNFNVAKAIEVMNSITDKTDDIENGIECLEDKVCRLNLSLMKDSETLNKLNEQMHVLSAKFVNFNSKMFEHINECKGLLSGKLEHITDSDAAAFMVIEKPNFIASKRHTTRRFVGSYDRFDYTRSFVVRIRDATIYNVDRSTREFKGLIESIIGQNYIEKIVVIDKRLDGDIVDQIDLNVTLQVPLNYEYIDRFMFPANWDFFKSNETNAVTR